MEAEGSMRDSIRASSSSESFAPSGPKNLIPLSEAGLWDAVTTAPRAAPPSLAARETAGVGTIPSASALIPPPMSPAPSARRSGAPEARVSRPIITSPERTPRDSSQRDAAAPRRETKASLMTGPP